MGIVVVTGAQLMCPFGASPAVLNASSQATCLGCSKPVATITDVSPGTNITTFGMCSSMANPQVASATAAAMGVLTPQPCTVTPLGTWTTSAPGIIVGGKPVLTADGCLMCSMGMGKITITSPGQTKIITG